MEGRSSLVSNASYFSIFWSKIKINNFFGKNMFYPDGYAKKYFFRNINKFLKFHGGFCSRAIHENVTGSKNTRFRKKKKSQKLKTFAPTKIDRLVPYMCGPSDQILEGSFLMVFRDFFFFSEIFR